METNQTQRLYRRIRINIAIIIFGLVISGVTAFPIETELAFWLKHLPAGDSFISNWVHTIYIAIHNTNELYPYLSYGTDWLAFAHIVIAIVYVGPYKDPVRNIWVIQFGMIASVLIFPLAFIVGPIRNIPFYWRLVDCSFGALCMIPLYLSYRDTKKLELLTAAK
ncbi:hypothetical protein KHS38_02250 [Mucilaginibacter sp. Bleaf8]|uniref:hypothetical protein n=1 Tax=Mucilaginibacter sp. Bleaf8 TaxID=2834430 RepID=UPI001BD063A7|nr:hypothetical protein [Mucilaginibacter sp. Bleaf8]MBS7563214.1 hypothetical protein [Mucilaginibacter sp. Bleaf8]